MESLKLNHHLLLSGDVVINGTKVLLLHQFHLLGHLTLDFHLHAVDTFASLR